MAIGFGPFESHVFPGTYTRTQTERIGGPPAGIRPLIVIGEGQEYLEVADLEVVRGSSSTVDQKMINEDASSSFVLDETNPGNPTLGPADGAHAKFRVAHYPIVTGEGSGQTTTSPSSVTVTVDGVAVAVAVVVGSTGMVTLQSIPMVGAHVLVTYYFKRTDTQITDTISSQVSSAYADLYAGPETYGVTAAVNDVLSLAVNGGSIHNVTLTAGTTRTAAQIVTDITAAAITGLTASVDVDEQGLNRLMLRASGDIVIGEGTANSLFGFSTGQTSGRAKTFLLYQRPVVDGTNGGITTNDATKVTVTVNGTAQTVAALDGANGVVTLATPPVVGATVTATYYFNAFQDTFDYLPNEGITEVGNCGIAPGRRDYTNLSDFVVADGKIYWGTASSTASDEHTTGAEPFDSTQISTLLVDDRIYMVACARYIDTSVVPSVSSSTEFVLPLTPTTGNGRDSPLGSTVFAQVAQGRIDLPSNRPDLVYAYHGVDFRDALNRGRVTVVTADSATRRIKLASAIPPNHNVYCTFWYNNLRDDTYTLTSVTAGPAGSGTYSILSTLTGSPQYAVKFDSKSVSLVETVQWPSGVETKPDAIHYGGTPVAETVTVTFSADGGRPAVFTNDAAGPYHCYASASDLFYHNIDNMGVANVDLSGNAAGSVTGTAVGTSILFTSSNNVLILKVDGVTTTLSLGYTSATNLGGVDPSVVFKINDLLAATVASVVGTGARSRLRLSSPTTPTTMDTVSTIEVVGGTAVTVLGLTVGQADVGVNGAVAKPATLLSANPSTYVVVAGVTDKFRLSVDGTSYEVTLTSGSTVAASVIAGNINTATGGSNAAAVTIGGSIYVRLMSSVSTPRSKLIIGNGTANTALGFTEGSTADQRLPTAADIDTVLNSSATFKDRAVARPITQSGMGMFLQLESLSVGATSSVAFGATTTRSAFNDTGLGIVPGVSGDVGEPAANIFTVTSSHSAGSGTGVSNTGYPGQTYTDVVTGLRFTVLPSTTGSYSSYWFKLGVLATIPTSSSVPRLAIPGLELTVANTVNVPVGDSAVVTTYKRTGSEPAIGDFYYISYKYAKTDYTAQIFTPEELPAIEALYGSMSAENKLSLAADVAFKNGAPYVGLKQVIRAEGQGSASAESYINAISELTQPLSGNIKPYAVVPLTTDTEVLSYLEQHCSVQSSPRYGNRRLGFFGFASGTVPSRAQDIAKSIKNSRMRCVYPDSAVIGITDELGSETEILIDSSFMSVALAASVFSPAIDFATPYTNRVLKGFKRLGRLLNSVEQSQTAIAGINVLEDSPTGLVVKQGFTTDVSDLLSMLPTVTQIDDLVQVNVANALNKYNGKKYLPDLPSDVQGDATKVLESMKTAELIADFKPAIAYQDTKDPTLTRVDFYYAPVLPNLYILVTQYVRVRI